MQFARRNEPAQDAGWRTDAMTPALIALVSLVMVATSLLSGVFGMAGGLILVGVLLALMPVQDAMVLHAVTQIASNGWRAAIWIRHARLRIVAAYAVGCVAALLLWSVVRLLSRLENRVLARA